MTAVILTYNSRSNISQCLDSLIQQKYDNLHIIVVDNLSSDGTLDFVKSNYPMVMCHSNGYNAGFAEGNNLGIQIALGLNPKYILILNDDTESDPYMIRNLVIAAENNPKIGIVSPKVMEMHDRSKLQQYGVSIDRFGFPSYKQDEKSDRVFYVAGCSMLIRADILKEVGLFDREYFMIAEDLDLCWRIQLAGYEVAVDQQSIMYHKGGSSIQGGYLRSTKYDLNKQRVYLRERNTLRTLLKNYSTRQLLNILPQYAVLMLAEFLFMLVWKPRLSLVYPSAVFWNVRHIRSTMKERKRIQMLKRVSDSQISKRINKGIFKLELVRKIGINKSENWSFVE